MPLVFFFFRHHHLVSRNITLPLSCVRTSQTDSARKEEGNSGSGRANTIDTVDFSIGDVVWNAHVDRSTLLGMPFFRSLVCWWSAAPSCNSLNTSASHASWKNAIGKIHYQTLEQGIPCEFTSKMTKLFVGWEPGRGCRSAHSSSSQSPIQGRGAWQWVMEGIARNGETESKQPRRYTRGGVGELLYAPSRCRHGSVDAGTFSASAPGIRWRWC
jgi:hypothetical protein